jgi:hypothetical protein
MRISSPTFPPLHQISIANVKSFIQLGMEESTGFYRSITKHFLEKKASKQTKHLLTKTFVFCLPFVVADKTEMTSTNHHTVNNLWWTRHQ